MEEETLTFSKLRKIEKTEKRQEELSELDQDFFLKVSRYLDRKKDVDNREYRNAKRVLDKIIGLRQDKIMKNAKLSVKTDVNASDLDMLPREQEFFREVRKKLEEYSEKVEEIIESGSDIEIKNQEEEETGDQEEDDEEYEKVKVVSEIPEFMGTDLESYGPFEEGEKVELPEENAEILVNRGSAERM